MFVLIFRHIWTHSLYSFFSPNNLWMNTDETNGTKHFYYQSNLTVLFCRSLESLTMTLQFWRCILKISFLLFYLERGENKASFLGYTSNQEKSAYVIFAAFSVGCTKPSHWNFAVEIFENFRYCCQSGSCETSG